VQLTLINRPNAKAFLEPTRRGPDDGDPQQWNTYLDSVPLSFFYPRKGGWTFEQRFRFALQLGLRKALKLVRLKRQVSETDEQIMADTIADHLRLANYRIEEGQLADGQGSGQRQDE